MNKRITLLAIVDLDPAPGLMHTTESAKNVVRNALMQRMPHYDPMVSTWAEHPRNTDDRKVYIIHVDLDPIPGTMHTEESALAVVRNILFQSMGSYNTEVLTTPPGIIPATKEGNTTA